jgi:phage-related protein
MKRLDWAGSSKKDLLSFPPKIVSDTGHALYLAQCGGKSHHAKSLKGFDGVMEIVSDHRGNTWRTVYAVQFKDAIYVLHAFQKKSTSGIATPQIELGSVDI